MKIDRHFLTVMFVTSLFLAAAFPAAAQEKNLLKNPGFEEPAVADHMAGGWAFTGHDQKEVRGEIEAREYHSGLQAAQIIVPSPIKVYVCWAQTVRVTSDDELPDEVSFWYLAPTGAPAIILGPSAQEGGKTVHKAGLSIPLEPTKTWKKVVQKITLPPGVRTIMLELRVSTPGDYVFDDVSLVRQNAAVKGPPDGILFVTAGGLGVPDAGKILPPLLKESVEKDGWKRVSALDWDDLRPSVLRRNRVLVLARVPSRPLLTERDRAMIRMLQDYVRAGGGLLLGADRQQVMADMTISQALAKAFGTRLLVENVVSDPSQARQIGEWGTDTYTYTTNVQPPVNEGVSGVVYQSAMHWMAFHGIVPFAPEGAWKVVLDAGTKSRSEPRPIGLDDFDRDMRVEGFSGNVPLAGIREFGAGRVGYAAMNSGNMFLRPVKTAKDAETYEGIMVKGWEGHKSDLMKFYLNLFKWLGAQADKLEKAELKLDDQAGRTFKEGWKLNRGVIGARTFYSSGRSTPEEYVAKAKAAGLDYVVFLEDFATLKPDGFENLKADCQRLTAADFVVIPGITWENSDGNHEFAMSDSLRLPSKVLLDRSCKKIGAMLRKEAASYGGCMDLHWLYTLLSFESSAGWYGFKNNPYPFYDARNINAMGVVWQEDGRIQERVLEAYGYQCRSGQFPWPVALTLMKDAQEIDLLKDGTYSTNVVGAESKQRLYDYFTTLGARGACHRFPSAPPFGTIFFTAGPVIELDMPRGDMDAEGDIYNPRLQDWPLKLKVTSEAGLREVRLMDGETLIRRFLPGKEKEFTYTAQIANEKQKSIWVHAFDVKGREAVSRGIHSNSWLLRENQCADRNNQLLDSRQKRKDGSDFFVGYCGTTAMPDKGPWCPKIRAVGCFLFDKKLGLGSMAYDGSPEGEPSGFMRPFLIWNGKRPEGKGWIPQLVADREGSPHNRPERVVADVLIADRVLDGVFPLEEKEVIHVWHSLFPVKPSKFLKTTARKTLYLIKPDGITAYLWDQTFEILQDIPVDPKSPLTVCMGYINGSRTKESLYQHGPGEAKPAPSDAPLKALPFDKGDYIGMLKDPFGSLAVYSLTDGLVLNGVPKGYEVGFPCKEKVLKAGTKLRGRILLVGMHRAVEDPPALAAAVRDQYGLAGTAKGYTVEAKNGKVTGQEYQLKLAAGADGNFQGTVKGLAGMAGNLGCELAGLNDRWTACLQVQGEKRKLRLIPVAQGTGYFVLQDREEDAKPLFVGHPFVADHPQAVLNLALSKDWKEYVLEVHNPTDKKMNVQVRNAEGLQGMSYNEKIVLAPGKSVFANLPVAGK